MSVDLEGTAPSRECPTCGHPADVAPKNPSWLRSLLGLKPRAAECDAEEFGMGGVGSEPCLCRDPAHGS